MAIPREPLTAPLFKKKMTLDQQRRLLLAVHHVIQRTENPSLTPTHVLFTHKEAMTTLREVYKDIHKQVTGQEAPLP